MLVTSPEPTRGPSTGSADPVPVQAFMNGLAIIRAFDHGAPRQTLAEIARAVNVTRATARRSLHTLEYLGYAATDGRQWRLTPRILELGYAFFASQGIWQVVETHLDQLAATLQESATAAMLDGDDVVYTARVAVRRIMTMTVDVGTRLPAYASALGRVLLASLPEEEFAAYLERVELVAMTDRTITDKGRFASAVAAVRRSGYCLVDQELETSIRSAAAPIEDEDGNAIGAIQVCCHASSLSLPALRSTVLPEVRRTARDVSHELQLRPTSRERKAERRLLSAVPEPDVERRTS